MIDDFPSGLDRMSLLQPLFAPKSIALIGASGDGAKNAGRPQRFLKSHGYGGAIFPVNPNRSEVQGVTAYASVRDIPAPVDHAFIMIPSHNVVEVLKDCAAAGVQVASIYSDGFAEQGADGAALQAKLVDTARALGVRLLGPNSMGVINTHNGMALSVNAVLEMPTLLKGKVSVISQSGTVLGTLLSRGAARGIGFSKMVSVGNESDISVGELAGLLVDDEETDAILLFLEGIRDADALVEASQAAHKANKPILVYKLGKSEAGRQLAVSHSGAMASSARTTDAFFKTYGLIEVEMLETLFEMPPLVMNREPRPGNRVSVVTTTGGGAAMVADRLGAKGLELVGPSPALRERLRSLNVHIGSGPLVDLTMAGTRDGVYGAALDELLNDSNSDAVVCVVGSSGQFHPELAVAPIVESKTTNKFLAAFIAPEAPGSLEKLNNAGIAAFRTPEACADAVSAALSWCPPKEKPAVPTLSIPLKSIYHELDALTLFEHLGVPVVPSQMTSINADLKNWTCYPAVAKVLSADIPHKSDIGGVRTGLQDASELRRALKEIEAAVKANMPEASLEKYIVQPMETGLGEVLLGYRRDPEVGPVLILGAGGLLTELLDDISIGIAPLDKKEAMQMIKSVKSLAPLRGYRGHPKGDLDALADAIVAFSHLATPQAAHIIEAEINPLLIKAEGSGVVALDGLVKCTE